jgi:hypothetical protein
MNPYSDFKIWSGEHTECLGLLNPMAITLIFLAIGLPGLTAIAWVDYRRQGNHHQCHRPDYSRSGAPVAVEGDNPQLKAFRLRWVCWLV